MRATWCSALSSARSSAASGSAGGGVRLHEVTLEVHGDLAELARVDARGVHLGEVDLDAARVVREASDLRDLVAGEILQPGRHRAVLASNDDVHLHLASVSDGDRARAVGEVYASACQAIPGGGVRAAVTATTMVRARDTQRGRGRGERGTGGGDVVDEQHARGRTARERRSAGRRAAPPRQARSAADRVVGRAGAHTGRRNSRATAPREDLRRIEAARAAALHRGGRPGDGGGLEPVGASAASAIAAASHGTTARALRYFTRATSSRPTPSVREGGRPRVDTGGRRGGVRGTRGRRRTGRRAARPGRRSPGR